MKTWNYSTGSTGVSTNPAGGGNTSWRIGEILVRKKLISWEQLEEVLSEQTKTRQLVGEILISKGYVSTLLFYIALAEQYKMRFIDLRRVRINSKAVEMIPQSIAEKYAVMPLEISHGNLIVAISNPLKVWPQAELKQINGVTEISPVLSIPEHIEQAIEEHYRKKH